MIPSHRHDEYYFFPWWPQDGNDWVHPDDIEKARKLIPGRRVFVRTRTPDAYDRFTYGRTSFRAQPGICKQVKGDGLRVGDRVEVYFRMGIRSLVGTICQMFYNEPLRRIEYRLRVRVLQSDESFFASDLRKLDPQRLPLEMTWNDVDSPRNTESSSIELDPS